MKSIDRMRPMPASVTRILNILEGEEASAEEVGDLLGHDQALAANVLQAANSAYLGYGPSCTNLSDAVMRLGFGRIRTLVLGVAAAGSLSGSLKGYRMGSGELWKHSISTAYVAQWLSKRNRSIPPEDAYVAGLLHDMGKLLLDQFALADYARLFDLVQNYGLTFFQVEQKLFGINHAQVGSMMANKWNFPQPLVSAIEFHHSPTGKKDNILASIVNVANAIAPADEETTKRLGKREINEKALHSLKIEPDQIDSIKEELNQYFTMITNGSKNLRN
ncbi:MAG: HDOD domain-containing protein [Anaerolineaceae bacterium]|nr:HDOD domain-containing protein [Anaerolineaceae bacterium]